MGREGRRKRERAKYQGSDEEKGIQIETNNYSNMNMYMLNVHVGMKREVWLG